MTQLYQNFVFVPRLTMELNCLCSSCFMNQNGPHTLREIVSLSLNRTRSVELKWTECTLLLQWMFAVIYSIRHFRFLFLACAMCQRSFM
jgi:hypothetical protein